MPKIKLAYCTALVIAWTGCTDAVVGTNPDGFHGTDGASTIGDLATTDGSTQGTDGSTTGRSVQCGDSLTCTNNCCFTNSVSQSMVECADTCSSPYIFRLGCDGPEDCGGSACCGSLGTGVDCTTSSACSAGVAQLCHVDNDCPAGKCCVPGKAGGVVEFDSCGALPGCTH